MTLVPKPMEGMETQKGCWAGRNDGVFEASFFVETVVENKKERVWSSGDKLKEMVSSAAARLS